MGRRKQSATPDVTAPTFVVDCSVVFAWFFVDERDEYADRVASSFPKAKAKAIAPSIWPLEVANTLVVGERRKRNTVEHSAAFLAKLGTLPIAVDDQTSLAAWSATIRLAREHTLSAYDAAYLELALRLGAPMATLDKQLRHAARAVGVSLFEP